MKIDVQEIRPEELLSFAQKFFNDGYRLVTVTGVDEGENFRLLYSFDRQLSLTNIELRIRREQAVPSISSVYACAFLVENEIKELFGITMDDISLDLGGRLYMVAGAKEAPMSRSNQTAGKGGE